jgi:uncharacterized protein DUF4340
MSRQRFTMLVIAALIVIGVAFLLASRRYGAPPPVDGTQLLPGVAKELGTVTEIDIRKGSATPGVTLQRAGAAPGWTLLQRGGYPADAAKVRRLLISLGDAKIVETKTANPANFPVIGVDEPSKPGAFGTEIGVVAKDGKHTVIIGKPIGEGNFARRGTENQSYTTAPGISAEADPRSWIDAKLLDVQASSIQSVELRAPLGAPGYSIHRLKPNEDGFAFDGALPAGRKLVDPKALAPSSMTLSGLDAEDVGAAGDLDFGKPTQAIYTLADGNVLTLTGVAAGDKHWIEVQATKDSALSAKTQGRAFEVASYRYDAIFRPLEQLLVPKEPPKDSKEPIKPAPPPKPTRGKAPESSPVPAP